MTKQQKNWTSDKELFALLKKHLYTSVVGDILDTFKRFHQFLPPEIRPLEKKMKLAGRAMPVLMMDIFDLQERPFGKMPEALDNLKEDEIYIAAGAEHRCANWGELMTAAAKMRKASGAVVYGYHRDTPQVLEQNFPVFSCGYYAQDSAPRMKIADFRIPIEINCIRINPGDLVFGDVDGVVIIPKEMETEVIIKSLEKARSEKTMRKEIEKGMSVVSAFNKYNIL